MKYIIILLFVLHTFCVASGNKDNVAKNIYDVLDSASITKNFNGLILIANSDSIFFCFSNGYADFEHKVDLDEYSVFNIASLTKQFTAAAILLLEENNELSTKDTISKYLPDFKYSNKITIHQLLTHSSGIPCYNNFEDYKEFSKRNSTNDEILKWIEQRDLNFDPGTEFQYSNSGYFILNLIIENVSGVSYRDYLLANIFTKADMENTDNYSSIEIIPNHASRYVKKDDAVLKPDWFNHSFKLGSSSIFSTSIDLFNWYKSLTNYRILSDSSVSKMFTDHYDGYGYGIGKGDAERIFYEHEGNIPGINAYSAFFFKPNYYLLVWSNTSNDEFWDIRNELRDILIQITER